MYHNTGLHDGVKPVPRGLDKQVKAASTPIGVGHFLAPEHHPFIRSLAASNSTCQGGILEQALFDPRKSVVIAALENESLSKRQYNETFDRIVFDEFDFCVMLYSALATSPLADMRQLRILLGSHNEAVVLEVLHNYKGRDHKEFQKLIKHLLPAREKLTIEGRKKLTEVEKIAYFRYHGVRLHKW